MFSLYILSIFISLSRAETITCSNTNSCANTTQTCQNDEECIFECNGVNNCEPTTFNCRVGYKCTLNCNDASCLNVVMNCPFGGECVLNSHASGSFRFSTINGADQHLSITSLNSGNYNLESARINCPTNAHCNITVDGRYNWVLRNAIISAQNASLLSLNIADVPFVLVDAKVYCPESNASNCIFKLKDIGPRGLDIYVPESFPDVSVVCNVTTDNAADHCDDITMHCGLGSCMMELLRGVDVWNCIDEASPCWDPTNTKDPTTYPTTATANPSIVPSRATANPSAVTAQPSIAPSHATAQPSIAASGMTANPSIAPSVVTANPSIAPSVVTTNPSFTTSGVTAHPTESPTRDPFEYEETEDNIQFTIEIKLNGCTNDGSEPCVFDVTEDEINTILIAYLDETVSIVGTVIERDTVKVVLSIEGSGGYEQLDRDQITDGIENELEREYGQDVEVTITKNEDGDAEEDEDESNAFIDFIDTWMTYIVVAAIICLIIFVLLCCYLKAKNARQRADQMLKMESTVNDTVTTKTGGVELTNPDKNVTECQDSGNTECQDNELPGEEDERCEGSQMHDDDDDSEHSHSEDLYNTNHAVVTQGATTKGVTKGIV